MSDNTDADRRADLAFHERHAARLRKELGLPDPKAELLAACEAIIDADDYAGSIGVTLDDHMNRSARREMLRAAIARAEGGAA